jgi:hypothetical protein
MNKDLAAASVRQAAAAARERALDKKITFHKKVSFTQVYEISVRDLMEIISEERDNVIVRYTEQNLIKYAESHKKPFLLGTFVFEEKDMSDDYGFDQSDIVDKLEAKNKIVYSSEITRHLPQQGPPDSDEEQDGSGGE